ncbi:hypothetical protein CRUP_038142, partial [Coryphaenoides rupestris]
ACLLSSPHTTEDSASGPLCCAEKLRAIKGILRFVVPLALVYYAEYFINQGLVSGHNTPNGLDLRLHQC